MDLLKSTDNYTGSSKKNTKKRTSFFFDTKLCMFLGLGFAGSAIIEYILSK